MSNPPFENISEKQSCYNCDDINIINQKVLSQKSIMEEYRHWLKMLLNIVKQNDFEYYPHIKNGIESIESLFKYHVSLKKTYSKETLYLETIDKKILQLTNTLNKSKEEIDLSNKSYVNEKLNLINSIQSISNEIDYYLEENNQYKEVIETSNKKDKILQLKERIKQLQSENQKLKKRVINKTKADMNSSTSRANKGSFANSNILSCFSNNTDQENTLFLSK